MDADATLSLFGLTTTALLKLTLQSCKEKKKKVFHSSPIFAAWFLKNVDDGAHCSKSSFFVHKFNFDFPRKSSIFLGEKLVKMLWFCGLLAVDNFDFTRKIVKKDLDEKLMKMLGFCQN